MVTMIKGPHKTTIGRRLPIINNTILAERLGLWFRTYMFHHKNKLKGKLDLNSLYELLFSVVQSQNGGQ